MKTLIPLIVGGLSGLVSGDFKDIERVPYQPPNWVFGPVWVILYILMGLSISGLEHVPTVFWVQLGLNFIWSPVYVRFKNPQLALVILCALWVTVLMSIVQLGSRGKYLYPYLAWITFAGFLNYEKVKSQYGDLYKSLQ